MSTGRCLSRGAAPTARGAFLVLVGPGGPKTVPFAPGPSMTPASVAFDEAAGPRKGWIAAAPPTLHLVVGAWNDHKMHRGTTPPSTGRAGHRCHLVHLVVRQ